MYSTKNKKAPNSLKLFGLILKLGTPIFPNAMKRLILNMWRRPPRYRMPEKEKIAIKSAVASYTIVDGMKIRTWVWGKGPTVLFIHGWGGRGTQVYSFIEALNQAGFQVMSIDMPAHGQSSENETDYHKMEKTITTILKNIDDLHSVVTHSFGGSLFSCSYRTALPLKKLVFISPPISLQTAFDYYSKTILLPEDTRNQIINTVKEAINQETIEKFSTLKNVTHITQPLLIIHDKNDDVVPISDGEKIAKNTTNCVFHVTQGLGHHRILHDKDIIKLISQFITEDH